MHRNWNCGNRDKANGYKVMLCTNSTDFITSWYYLTQEWKPL